jgi:hypothetical protein
MIGSLEVVAAPADFDFRLRARLAAAKSVGARNGAWHRFAPGAWSLALAASFVILIAVGLIVRLVWLAPASSIQPQELANNNPVNEQSPAPAPSAPALAPTAPAVVPKQSGAQNGIAAPVTASVQHQLKVRQQTNVNRGVSGKQEIISNTSDGNEGGGTYDSALRSAAPSRMPPGIPDPVSNPGAMIAVPVQASRKPATVTLNYGSAKSQMLLLRPVTFGAQDVFERGDVQRIFISSAQGVW